MLALAIQAVSGPQAAGALQIATVCLSSGTLGSVVYLIWKGGRVYERIEGMERRLGIVEEKVDNPAAHCRYAPSPECGGSD